MRTCSATSLGWRRRGRSARWRSSTTGSGVPATALAPHGPTVLGDSFLARRATVANLVANGVDPATVVLGTSLDPPAGPFATLLVKAPKSLDQLEDQLQRVRPALADGASRRRRDGPPHPHLDPLAVFQRVLGPTTTSRAEQKAWARVQRRDRAGHPHHLAPVVHRPRRRAPRIHRRAARGRRPWWARSPPGSSTSARGCCSRTSPTTRPAPWSTSGAAPACSPRPTPGRTRVGGGRHRRERPGGGVHRGDLRRQPGPRPVGPLVVGDGLFDLDHGPPITAGSVDLVLNNPPFHDDHAVGDATRAGAMSSATPPGAAPGRRALGWSASATWATTPSWAAPRRLHHGGGQPEVRGAARRATLTRREGPDARAVAPAYRSRQVRSNGRRQA